MLTTAITGAIAAVLAGMGIAPGPYLALVWIAVKVVVVGGIMGISALTLRRKQRASTLDPEA